MLLSACTHRLRLCACVYHSCGPQCGSYNGGTVPPTLGSVLWSRMIYRRLERLSKIRSACIPHFKRPTRGVELSNLECPSSTCMSALDPAPSALNIGLLFSQSCKLHMYEIRSSFSCSSQSDLQAKQFFHCLDRWSIPECSLLLCESEV